MNLWPASYLPRNVIRCGGPVVHRAGFASGTVRSTTGRSRSSRAAESGQILLKYQAAERVRPRLDKAEADLLALAKGEYLGRARVDWRREHDRTLGVVQTLRHLIHEAADVGTSGTVTVFVPVAPDR